MKAWKILTLCAILSLVAMTSVIILVSGEITYKYYYISLTESGAMGDCYASERYNDVTLMVTGLVSATPQPYTIAVGYIVNPDQWGTAVYYVLTSPGWGPSTATYGSYYAIWGNFGSNDENIVGRTYTIW